MRKLIRKIFTFTAISILLVQSSAAAGVGGVGNTGDILIQFEFAKEAALEVLRNVSAIKLYEHNNNAELKSLYRHCRETMYRGLARTTIEVVDEIPDGGEYHALVQRTSDFKILVSRMEIERIKERDELSIALLTAVVLHEVGHDCVIDGNPVDDSYDVKLNELGKDLYVVARAMRAGGLKDLALIQRVQNGETVEYKHLSKQSREILVNRYLDFVGDWLYKRYRGRFYYRPAPASRFFATDNISVYSGWSDINNAVSDVNDEMQAVVFGVLRSTFESKELSFYNNFQRNPLSTKLNCTLAKDEVQNLSYADCQLGIYWSELPLASLREIRQKMKFTVDSLGRLRLKKINMYNWHVFTEVQRSCVQPLSSI